MGFGSPLELAARSFVLDSPAPLYESKVPYDRAIFDPASVVRQLTPLIDVGEFSYVIVTVDPSYSAGVGVDPDGSISLLAQWTRRPSGSTAADVNTVRDLWGYGTTPQPVTRLGLPVLYPYLTLFAAWHTHDGLLDTSPKDISLGVWGTNREVSVNPGQEHVELLTIDDVIPGGGTAYYRLPCYYGAAYLTQAVAVGAMSIQGRQIDSAGAPGSFPNASGYWYQALTAAGTTILAPQRVLLTAKRNYLQVVNQDAIASCNPRFNLRREHPQ